MKKSSFSASALVLAATAASLLCAGALALLSACGGAPPPDSITVLPTEGGGEGERGPEEGSLNCAGGEEKVDGVSITGRLEYIDASNSGKYVLKGRCSQNNRAVEITVNNISLDEGVVCKSKKWEVALNLTPLFTGNKGHGPVIFKARQSRKSQAACRTTRAAFRCPAGYVPVPSLKNYTEDSFCVMKYEAKLSSEDNSKAVSVPEGPPLTSVSHQAAKEFCGKNGSGYNLITNDQWQTIARHIEKEGDNWFLGRPASRTPGNFINCGVNRGAPRAASADDGDGCAKSLCRKEERFSYYNRTHFLPGENNVIWVFCGNVGEMMRDANRVEFSHNLQVSALAGLSKDRYGPEKEYSIESAEKTRTGRRTRETRYWGLGEAKLKKSGSLVVRGGKGSYAGIFSVNLDKDQNDSHLRNTGFRCVYNP